MNILNDLTLKNLKLNKKRTIVTIIGIILSTALICAVAGMVSSFQATLIKNAKDENGNRHVTVEEVSLNDLKYFTNNSHIKSAYLVENIGYANLEGSKNPNKPYLFIKGYTKEAFNDSKINLVSGRLPNDEHEIVISESVIKNAQVPLKVGDTLTLDISDRISDDGSKLNQSNPYFTKNDHESSEEELYTEKLVKKYTKEYKIVGIMERPSYNIEGYSAPGYVAITYSRKVSNDSVDVSLLFNDGSYYKTFIKNINESEELKDYNVDINRDLLRWEGIALSDNSFKIITTVAGVVIGIIILTSVFVIKNSFDISIVEKTKQYGMLRSVGATSKQIKKNVLYEGFILGAIGIPLGILSGIFADFVLVQVINILGSSVFNDIKFIFKVPMLPILLSAVLSAITIYLSVIRTAHKTSKISPITAIRNNNEIKITNKKLKTPKIIGKIFGIGGDIAYKNLKRSKKKYRTTVISIVVSVAVFISLSTFISYGFKLTGQYYTDYKYNIQVSMNSEKYENIEKVYNDIKSLDKIDSISFQRQAHLEINAKDYYSDEAFFRNYGVTKQNYKPQGEHDLTVLIDLVSLGDEYESFIKSVGGNIEDYIDKGILLDDVVLYNSESEKYEIINTYDISKTKYFEGTYYYNDKNIPFKIDVAKRSEERPMGLEHTYNQAGYLIVSDKVMDEIKPGRNATIYIDASDPDTLETNIKKIFANNPEVNDYHVYNIKKDADAQKSFILLVSIFLYGFIIVISLIGITNIFNTLTTNMNLRKKEFAMLKSIGMTKKEFNKMIRLESLMYGTKSLFIGIPLGLAGSYLMYKAFASGNDMNFLVPYTAIIISCVAVYALVGLIMHFSLKKTENQNIIETIRNDNI